MFNKIGSFFSKARSGLEEKMAERERLKQEKAAQRAREAENLPSFEITRTDYEKFYQAELDKYIEIQANTPSDDNYGRLKIIEIIGNGQNSGYFKLDAPNCTIHWVEGIYKEKKELMAILLTAENLEEIDKFGGVLTFLYPAIHAIYKASRFIPRSDSDRIVKALANFISDKSVEQIQSLQGEIETATTPIDKVDWNNDIQLLPVTFAVELNTHYNFSADELSIGFSVLIFKEKFMQMFKTEEEKIKRNADLREKILSDSW